MQSLFKNLFSDAVYDQFESPMGLLTIIASPTNLYAVLWENEYQNMWIKLKIEKNNKVIIETINQLTEYFQGKRKIFDLPLTMHGTEFQLKTWEILQKIPYASTMTYAEQAEKLGNKNKARAVGAANSLNPLSIIVPCHRVIGANGKLTGFRGGLSQKKFLLELEKSY
ncbi:MAG TPA: methylated-DNA--[protein]-cysteine S-methyltransferase [Gammaproteobacteria bacterium]|jgi:methylated-DNA-[protein]-cysteine S-methyltransferase|nr:methylated-DNA--[protein]-cysteine S-methyltransferase [Gammaproteobacteria bacterium]